MSQTQSNNALMQQLRNYFSLSSDPFSEESGFFFEGAQRKHNVETLCHMASFADMVLFLTGDKGSGKTKLLKKLQTSEIDGLNVIYLDCEKMVQEGQGRSTYIIEACLNSLGTKKEGSDLKSLLNQLLKECHRLVASTGERTLLAFDNSDRLPRKELQEYCAFCKELPPESAIVMLFAGSSLITQVSKLGSNLDKGGWWHQIQLKPLSEEEVLSYLEQALTLSGFEGKLELTDLQIQQLVELGKGLPGRINKLLASVILEPGLLKIKKQHNSTGAPLWIMFGLAGLLVASFLFVSYQHGLFKLVIPVFSLDSSEKTSSESKVVDDGFVIEKNLQQQNRLEMLNQVLKEKGISAPMDKDNEEKVIFAEQLQGDEVSQGVVPVNETVLQEKINKLPEKDSRQEVTVVELDGLEALDSKDVSPSRIEGSGTEKESVLDIVEKGKDLTSAGQGNKTKELQVEKRALSPYFRSKEWLQGLAKGSYLAQILGSYSEQTALNFIQKIGKQEFEVYYLITEHKGKPWYVVFYGAYPAKSHAQDAVKSSPKMIKSQNPWIRASAEVLSSYPK